MRTTQLPVASSWVILTEIETQIKKKIEQAGRPLRSWNIHINYGIKTGFNDAFIITEEECKGLIKKCSKSAEIIRPILKGKHIKKYGQHDHQEWIILIPCGWTNDNRNEQKPEVFFKTTFPAIYDHLILKSQIPSKGKGLFDRDDQGDYWWELRPCSYLKEFKKEKLLYIDIMTDNEPEGYPFPCFSYDNKGSLTLNTSYFIVGDSKDLKYSLGVLNSKIGSFIVRNHVTPLQKRQYRMFQQFVEAFPIPVPTEKLKEELINLVEKIINDKANKVDTSLLELEINQLLFTLCDFSVEECELLMS